MRRAQALKFARQLFREGLASAARAPQADQLLIEVDDRAGHSRFDGDQIIDLENFRPE